MDNLIHLDGYRKHLLGIGRSHNTINTYWDDLNTFSRFLESSNLTVMAMTRPVARKFICWMATEGRLRTTRRRREPSYSWRSVDRKLSALRAYYRFLTKQRKLFQQNPVPPRKTLPINVEKPLPKFLNKEQARRLVESPQERDTPTARRDLAILEVLYACGLRRSEIRGLNLADVNLDKKTILVRGRGGDERYTVFGEPACKALRLYLSHVRPQLMAASRPGVAERDALFLNRYGRRLSCQGYYSIIKRWAAVAGLRNDLHPHVLRHTFATHLLEGGCELRVIQELLGHRKAETTELYTHITHLEAKAAYLRFHPRSSQEDTCDRT